MSALPYTNEETGFHCKKNPKPNFLEVFLCLQTLLLYFSFTNSSSSDNEDSNMRVCKVFLVLRPRGREVGKLTGYGFNKLRECKILPKLVVKGISMIAKGKHAGLQKARHQRH